MFVYVAKLKKIKKHSKRAKIAQDSEGLMSNDLYNRSESIKTNFIWTVTLF